MYYRAFKRFSMCGVRDDSGPGDEVRIAYRRFSAPQVFVCDSFFTLSAPISSSSRMHCYLQAFCNFSATFV